jgi:hypothetical protein
MVRELHLSGQARIFALFPSMNWRAVVPEVCWIEFHSIPLMSMN